jgi:hypothetical protein
MKKYLFHVSLLLCTLCAAPSSAAAQAPDGETKPNGFRVKSNQVVTIYADYQGQPNPFARYSLDDIYYFKVQGDSVLGCVSSPFPGQEFTKIMIPGNPGKSDEQKVSFQQMDQQRNTKAAADAAQCPICPDAFPAPSPGELQVAGKQLGGTFWILTSDLVKSAQVIGKTTATHVNSEVFDATYIHSRWFVAALAVPFKYRLAKSKSSLTGESTIGAALGWTFKRDRNFDNRFWLMGAGGLTLINPNSAFDDANSEKQKNIPGVTVCAGIGANIKKTQAGLMLGFDFADPSWEYHAKPWVSLSVGFAFLSPSGDSKNH